MSQDLPLHTLLMQLAATVRDLCQRQIDKHRLLDNLNLDAIVDDLLCEHALEADFDQQFLACIDAMSQPDAIGQTLVFERIQGKLHMRWIDTRDLSGTGIDGYEMVLFDGGKRSGERWKHVFFPAPRQHCFVYENA
jgi:hypothetical protein